MTFPTLSRLASRARNATPAPRCDMCAAPLEDAHRHLVEVGRRGVLCTCRACGLLFTASDARYKVVPDRVIADPTCALTPGQWSELGIPVSLAFCYLDSATGGVTLCYPGPAGIVEGELAPDAWNALVAATPLAGALEHDVEALLVHGKRGAEHVTSFLVPISTAYELAARLRTSWRGISGGPAANRVLDDLFLELARKGARQ